MFKIIFILILNSYFNWEVKRLFGHDIFQLETDQIAKFLDLMHEHAVMEIKKGTSQTIVKQIFNYFQDYFIFFERPHEQEIQGGGLIVYPAGFFDHKFSNIEFFKPEAEVEVTKDTSKPISVEQLDSEIKHVLKQSHQLPVILINNKKHDGDQLGYRYLTYNKYIQDHFRFFHIEGNTDQIIQGYKLESLPSLLVFNKIKQNYQSKEEIRVAIYNEDFHFKPLVQFLEKIVKTNDEHKGSKNRHSNDIYYFSHKNDPYLNHCWKKNCLIVFESNYFRTKEEVNFTKEILQSVQQHFHSSELEIYFVEYGCYQDLAQKLRIFFYDLPVIKMYQRKTQTLWDYHFKFSVSEIVDYAQGLIDGHLIGTSQIIKLNLNNQFCDKSEIKLDFKKREDDLQLIMIKIMALFLCLSIYQNNKISSIILKTCQSCCLKKFPHTKIFIEKDLSKYDPEQIKLDYLGKGKPRFVTRDENGMDLKTYDISSLDRKTIREVIEKLGFKNILPLEIIKEESSSDDQESQSNEKKCPEEILEMVGNEL